MLVKGVPSHKHEYANRINTIKVISLIYSPMEYPNEVILNYYALKLRLVFEICMLYLNQ